MVQVRLDKASLPAPAVASLYVTDGDGAGMLSPENALYHAAVHLTWPQAMTDDDAYLCCFISELLLSADETQGERHLPRFVYLRLGRLQPQLYWYGYACMGLFQHLEGIMMVSREPWISRKVPHHKKG
jgi:hypothetical protein